MINVLQDTSAEPAAGPAPNHLGSNQTEPDSSNDSSGVVSGSSLDSTVGVRALPVLLNHGDLRQLHAQRTGDEWLVENLIEKDSIVLVTGDSGLGKSPLLYQLGIAAAAGVPFLGHSTQPGRVIYVDAENGFDSARKMAESISRHLGLESIPSNFHFSLPGYTQPVNHSTLEEILAKFRPTLCIIDPLRAFDSDADAKNNAASTMMNRLRLLARKYHTTIVILHHTKKPNEFTPALEETTAMSWLNEASGARGLVNHSDTRIGIDLSKRRASETDQSEQVAFVMKGFTRVRGEFGPLYVGRVFDDAGDELGYRLLTSAELVFTEHQREAFEGLPDEFTTGDAKRLLQRGDQPTALFLKKLEANSLVTKISRGQYRKVRDKNDRVM